MLKNRATHDRRLIWWSTVNSKGVIFMCINLGCTPQQSLLDILTSLRAKARVPRIFHEPTQWPSSDMWTWFKPWSTDSCGSNPPSVRTSPLQSDLPNPIWGPPQVGVNRSIILSLRLRFWFAFSTIHPHHPWAIHRLAIIKRYNPLLCIN